MEQRWRFLAPWCAALKGELRYDLVKLGDTNERRLLLSFPTHRGDGDAQLLDEDTFSRNVTVLREALALVAAVAHVDYAAWIHLISTYCELGLGAEGDGRMDKKKPVEFFLHLDPLSTEVETVPWVISQFCGTSQRDHSQEYTSALAKIAEITDLEQELEVPVHVLIWDDRTSCLDGFLTPGNESDAAQVANKELMKQRLLQAADTIVQALEAVVAAEKTVREQWEIKDNATQQDSSHGPTKCTLVLKPMSAALEASSMTPRAMEKVKWLLNETVPTSHLNLSVRAYTELLEDDSSRIAFGRLLARTFQSITHVPITRSGKSFQIGHVSLTCGSTDYPPSSLPNLVGPREYAAMCSALVTNQTTASVSIHFHNFRVSKPRKLWKWLAYGLFSTRARERSRLESLSLSGHLPVNATDMECFSAIVNSVHPEEELCGRPRGLVQEREAVLSAGSQLRWSSDFVWSTSKYSAATTSDMLSFETDISVRTFSDDGSSAWVYAMVPGFGVCQVQRGDLAFDEPIAIGMNSGLLSLTLQYADWECDGLSLFLQSIGRLLRSLTLFTSRDRVDINMIRAACPNLAKLTLCGDVVRLRLDFRRIRKERNEFPPLCVSYSESISVLKDLSFPSSPYIKFVDQVRIEVPHRDIFGAAGICLDILPAMLQVNEHVRDVEVVVPSGNTQQYQRNYDELRAFHLVPLQLAERLSPMGLVAFLSVISTRSPSEETNKITSDERGLAASARNQLSLFEFVKILAFAGLPVVRKIVFRAAVHGED